MIGLTSENSTIEITGNEYEILRVLREMKPNDKIIIQKLRPNNKVELFLRIERAIFMQRENPGFIGGQKCSRME